MVATSEPLVGVPTFSILLLPICKSASIATDPEEVTNFGPIVFDTGESFLSLPNRLLIYPTTAFSTGTAVSDSSAIVSSIENSSTDTPFLKPNSVAPVIPISPEKLIEPCAWSTAKNCPTRKKPYWSVLIQNTRPLRLSQT